MAPAPRDPSVGAPPYRDAPLTPPQPPPRPRTAAGLASGAFAALCVLRVLFAKATTTPPPPALYIESATSLAGGAQITAVFTDRDARRRAVLRVPGTAVQRGTDTVAAPEVIAAHGAVAASPDGEHLVDEHGELLRVRDGVVAPLPGVEVAPFPVGELLPEGARVVQRAGAFARMDNGALFAFRSTGAPGPALAARWLVRDVATDGAVVCALGRDDRVSCARSQRWEAPTGLNTPDAWAQPVWDDVEALAWNGAEQVVTGGGVACVRDGSGGVSCARVNPPRRSEERFTMRTLNLPLPLRGDPPRATAVAIGRDDLCLLGVDGHLWCVHGPQEDATFPLYGAPLRLHDAMEGVAEVGLAEGVGCARRGGRIDCWGPLARGGWVVTRERPVRIDGLRGVGALVAAGGNVCALAGQNVWCWGVDFPSARAPVPTSRDAIDDEADGLFERGDCLCDGDHAHASCWLVREPEPGSAASRCQGDRRPVGLTPAPGVVRSVWGEVPFAEGGGLQCALTPDHRVACGRAGLLRSGVFSALLVPGLERVTQIAVTQDGLACALQDRGDVWCWGDNTSGVLTAAEAARSPRVVTLRR